MSAPLRFLRFQGFLAAIGYVSRTIPRFFLSFIGAGWGVFITALNPLTWRKAVQMEFWRGLYQATAGGLWSTLVVGVLSGFAIVAQAVYWLGFAGMAQSTGSVLAHILIREIAPVLVGIILLGRSGMVLVAELCTMSVRGQVRALLGMGIDPFVQFVVPRSVALTLSSFTLGMLFSITALVTGYIACWIKNLATTPVWTFLFQVSNSILPMDYIGIPLKFLLSGFAVGLSSTLTGLGVSGKDDLAVVMPRGFTRGIVAILFINVAVDVVFG